MCNYYPNESQATLYNFLEQFQCDDEFPSIETLFQENETDLIDFVDGNSPQSLIDELDEIIGSELPSLDGTILFPEDYESENDVIKVDRDIPDLNQFVSEVFGNDSMSSSPEQDRYTYDFNTNFLNVANHEIYNNAYVEEIPSYVNNMVISETKYQYATNWGMSDNVPVFNVQIFNQPSSPCYSDISASSYSTSASFDSTSSTAPAVKGKRGRKRKNVDKHELETAIKSAKDADEVSKIKNNDSSRKYRKRKSEEREQIDRELAAVTAKNKRLQAQLQRNLDWFQKVNLLFPDVRM